MAEGNICKNVVYINSTSAPIVGLSPYELWTQLILFYVFLCGIVSTVCSVLVWIGIVRNKVLRSRFFIIVGCLTFCRTGICLQFLTMGIYRSLRTLKVVSICQARLVCHTIHFWLIAGWTVEMFLLFTLVADRVIAIVKPVYYRKLTRKSALHLCIIIYIVISFTKLVPSYLSEDMLELAPCVNIYSAPSRSFNEFSQDIDFIMGGGILLLYFSLIIYVRKKVQLMKEDAPGEQTDVTKIALKRQLKLMPILRNLVLMHCGLALSSKILLTLGAVTPAEINQRFTAYGGIMSCLDVFTNVTMLLVTNREIKLAAIPCFAKKDTKVVVLSKGSPVPAPMKSTEHNGPYNIVIPDHAQRLESSLRQQVPWGGSVPGELVLLTPTTQRRERNTPGISLAETSSQ